MFFLEQHNRIVADTLRNAIKTSLANIDVDAKDDEVVVESNVWDMDDAQMLITTKSTSVSVSIKVPYFDIIRDKGAMDHINTVYAGFVSATPVEGYNVTITATRDQWAGQEDEVINKFALLRRHLIAGVFEKYIRACKNEALNTLEGFEYRSTDDTLISFAINDKHLMINFTLDILDKADREIARIFMTELVTASRNTPRAPNMVFKPETIAEKPTFMGTFTFIIRPPNGEDRILAQTADLVHSFRNFLQYHIKVSKSHFHSRMRNRVVELVKILNRAKG